MTPDSFIRGVEKVRRPLIAEVSVFVRFGPTGPVLAEVTIVYHSPFVDHQILIAGQASAGRTSFTSSSTFSYPFQIFFTSENATSTRFPADRVPASAP